MAGLLPESSSDPRILILGSYPGIISLERQEYYGNPKNRFWAVMEILFAIPASLPYRERTMLLTHRGIALWDVLAGCERAGSADSRIRNPVPNHIAGFVRDHPAIRLVALNGSAAGRLYRNYAMVPGLPFVVLPSTSPANAALSFDDKLRAWGILKNSI